ncbi:hypothetical protein Acr_12g0003150 [Actinidia rufa]|uniref:Serine protease inhibitor, potato inhibitor I-type family protein n=1 Tax=Actinidia rufa TaxID=165716 RepID=A0A7J0FGE1_9ERIC|nr:hypothetical protein Acr_12g0003150 [Actinidia rufa]
MSSICQEFVARARWGEGRNGRRETIERENPLVNAKIVLEGTPVIENFDCRRVWVWVDENNVVTCVPVIG